MRDTLGLIAGLGRSTREGKSYPLSVLAWRNSWAVVRRGAKVGHDSEFHFHFHFRLVCTIVETRIGKAYF